MFRYLVFTKYTQTLETLNPKRISFYFGYGYFIRMSFTSKFREMKLETCFLYEILQLVD